MKIEMLFCPTGCDVVRSGDRERERFTCPYCKKELRTEDEIEMEGEQA